MLIETTNYFLMVFSFKIDNIMLIENNTVLKTGGGLYLYRSELHCQHNSTIQLLGNTATEKGGGVNAINSIITIASEGDFGVESSIHFTENTANYGGGIHLELTSVLSIVKVGMHYTVNAYNLYFTSNSAGYGGAIFVTVHEKTMHNALDINLRYRPI